MEATSGTHTSLPARRSRRRWSHAEKLELLEMAQASSISSVAKQNNINPSLMFSWRADLGLAEFCAPKAGDRRTLAEWYQVSLAQIDTLSTRAGGRIVESFLADLDAKRISTFNAANCYCAIANALCRLQAQSIELAEKLSALPPPPDPEKSEREREVDEKVRRLCEQALLALANGGVGSK